MKKLIYITAIVVLGTSSARAQAKGWKDVSREQAVALLQKSNAWYSATASYSFTITHAIYAGHNTPQPYEQSTGYFRKLAGGFHSRILGVHTMQNKDVRVAVDTTQQVMLVSDPVREGGSFSTEEYMEALKKCSSIKMTENAKSTVLRMEFGKNSSLSQYELEMDQAGRFKTVTILYAHEVESQQGTRARPKMVLTFEKYATGVVGGKNEMSASRYFAKEQNQLVPAAAFRDYALSDQRLPDEKQ